MHWWLTLLMNHAKFKYPAWYKPTMASYRPPVTKKKLTILFGFCFTFCTAIPLPSSSYSG
uniref:Uncharacterized protein MANES_04G031200 n=1 Tax=Rhizophora mucronata TaxID=61149 RepID=A0A2P2J7E1_RHIMU